jgi:mitotic spindle assembly checkpoint protein MAD1
VPLILSLRLDMSSQATAAKDAANAPTIFSLKPQHADDPDLMLVFRLESMM